MKIKALLIIFIGLTNIYIRPQSFRIIESNQNYIQVEFQFDNIYQIVDTLINGRNFQVISGGEFSFWKAGEPWLPKYTANICIPFNITPKLRIINSEKVSYQNKFILPFPDEEQYLNLEAIKIDQSIYSTNEDFPSEIVSLNPEYVMRYSRILPISVFPFQFNPVTRELKFRKTIIVRILFVPDNNISGFYPIEDTYTKEFLKGSVINPEEAVKYQSVNSGTGDFSLIDSVYWYNPNKDWYKIYLKEKGLYRITFEDLVNSGIPLGSGIESNKLELVNNGLLVPLDVHDNNDSLFQPGDFFQFIGYPPASTNYCYFNIYNTSNVYWFSYQADSIKRYENINGYADSWVSTIQQTKELLHYEVDSLFERLGYAPDMNRDYWFWGTASGMRGNYLKVFNGYFNSFENWFLDSLKFILRVNLHGMSTSSEHHVLVRLTSQPVDSAVWSGQKEFTTETYVDASQISIYPTLNGLQVFADGIMPPDSSDEIRINWFELEYWRQHRAFENNFRFTSNKGHYGVNVFSIYNWKSDTIWIYSPQKSKMITNARFLNNIYDELLFKDTLSEQIEYFCASPDYFLSVDSIEKDNNSTLREISNEADYIIITHNNFMEAALDLANYRQTKLKGFTNPRIKIVEIQDIYDEFSYGMLDPFALKSFVKYAFENWQGDAPSYVVLMGDMSWDYRGINYNSRPNFIPSIPFKQSTYGQAFSDNNIVAVAGNDYFPDLSIGRLSCETLDEANILIDKIIRYPADNNKPWKENVLLIGSGQNLADEQYFGFNDQSLLLENNYIKPFGYTTSKVFRYPSKPEHIPFQGSTTEIRKAFNDGCVIANFYGHGGGYQWDLVFLNDDIYQLENGGKLPFISSITCYTAHFDNQNVFGEQFNKVPGKGSIGFWGSSGLTYWGSGVFINTKLFNSIFVQKNFVLGPAIVNAFSQVNDDQVSLMTLLGDPGLELAIPEFPDFGITSSNISYTPQFPLIEDSLIIKLKVTNFGRIFSSDSVDISLFITSQDTSFLLDTKYLESFGQSDSLTFGWKTFSAGELNLRFEINSNNSTFEVDHLDNISSTSLYIFNLNEPSVLKPIDGYKGKEVVFIFNDVGHYINKDLLYTIQIDTSIYFESPILQDSLLKSVDGVVKYNPVLNSGNYFWRTRLLNNNEFSNWTETRTFRIDTLNDPGFYSIEKQMTLFSTDNIFYFDSLKSLVLNTLFNPPKPSNSKLLDTVMVELPADISNLTASTTDGKYIYFADMAYYNQLLPSKIYMMGTGNGGTIKGKIYGNITGVEVSLWNTMFYYPDGFLYAATGDAYSLQKINPNTGDTSRVQIPQGMLNEAGRVSEGAFYLCTDGNYVYNLALRDTLNNMKYHLRILNPNSNWTIVEEKTLTGSSYDGFASFFVADGYLYAYENFMSGFLRRINISTGIYEEEWFSYEPNQLFYTWSFDWLNNALYASVNHPQKPAMYFKFLGRYKKADGKILTSTIGPALEWENLKYTVDKINPESAFEVILEGLNNQTKIWDTLGSVPPDFSLSNIKATEYPLLRLTFSFVDSSFSELYPLRLRNIGLRYKTFPELYISKNFFNYSPDSLLQGYPITMKTRVKNVGDSPADTINAAFYMNNSDSIFYQTMIPRIEPDSSIEIEYVIPTAPLAPATLHEVNTVITSVTPEFYDFNNTVNSSFYVARDSINPLFSVTIDGKEVINGDIVSANPEIIITLKDNSPLPLDTSYFTIIYTYYGGQKPEPVKLDFNRSDIQYTYSPYPNSESIIKWNPLLKDGKHTLEMLAKDASGNFFDSTYYRIVFSVFNDFDLQYVYNYPNPFKDNTYFTFELRGDDKKFEEFFIKIYTIAGRLIKEISVEPSQLKAGFNKILWDGRDQDGDELANGLYFYKLITKGDGHTKTTIQKLAKVK